MYWTPFRGEGLPAFSFGVFDEAVGHDAPPSFRFDLRGGSIGYEYAHGDLAIFPDSDYLVEAYIRTAGLDHAHAFLVCYLVDAFSQEIPESRRLSDLVASGADETIWQRVEIALPGDFPEARAMRLQLWVLQDYAWQLPEEQAVDPIIMQDVQAQVWFDDIRVHRMPRVRLALSNPGSVVRPGAAESVVFDVHNATLAPVAAHLTVRDEAGAEYHAADFELPPQTTDQFDVPLPALDPGLYSAHVTLTVHAHALMERRLQFAVLPELHGANPRKRDLGMDLGRWYSCDEQGAEELTLAAFAGGLKVGLPMIGTPETAKEMDYLRQVGDLARSLALAQVQTTAVILSPAAGEQPDSRHSTWRMVVADDAWDERVGPVFAYYGGYLLSWQLGTERFELKGPHGWTADTIGRMREKLDRFVAAPELIVNRSVLDAAPSNFLEGDGGSGAVAADLHVKTEALHAYSFWLPPEIPARSIPWHLAFWFEPERDPEYRAAGGFSDGMRRGPQRWISIGFEPDERLSPSDRLADLARRIVLSQAVNPDRVYVPAPFGLSTDAGKPTWQPAAEYIPLRTLFYHLSDQRAVASLTLVHDAVAILFEQGGEYTLVVWSWQPFGDEVTADLYVGEDAWAVGLDGVERRLDQDGPLAHVPLAPLPLIIKDVDAALLRLQDSFRVEPDLLQLHAPEPRPVLKLRNYYRVELIGSLQIEPPKNWEVAPNPMTIELGPGESLEEELYFTIPPRQIASRQSLGVHVRLKRPEELDLYFEPTLQVELRDIVVRGVAWWDGDDLVVEQTLYNQSSWPVSFNAFCQARNRAQEEGLFLNVLPGDVRTQRYRFPSARDLAGGKLWVGIQEIDGRRTLDQLVSIPY